MAHEDGQTQADIIKKLIETSKLQRRLASEGRIEELFATKVERERLFERIDLTGEPMPELRALAIELAESDRDLTDAVQRMMDAAGARLGQIKIGMTALKAYGRY